MTGNIYKDTRTIMTLDAGGTNFVFSAIRGGEDVVEAVETPAFPDNLDKMVDSIISGFQGITEKMGTNPDAISFAFPGPADYPNGIIGNLPNFPAFKGGFPLKALLEEKFNIPVFINNDGNLFAYGEAVAGFLPWLNKELEANRNIKRYHTLSGITLGTGFGGGVVINNELFIGDNSNAAEIWCIRDHRNPNSFAEEGISKRAIIREFINAYPDAAGEEELTPRDIHEFAVKARGDKQQAAQHALAVFGKNLGEAMANIATIVDGPIVIGGGLAGAYELFMPSCLAVLNGEMETYDGTRLDRLPVKFYDMEDDAGKKVFFQNKEKEIEVPFTSKKIRFDDEKRLPIGKSVLGASRAISVGAYSFAINRMDNP